MAQSRMTNWCALLVLATFALAGCQPQQQVSLNNLPEPNFGGPTFVDRAPAPPPAPVVVAPAPKPAPLKPIEPPAESVPAAWIPHSQANHWYWIIIHHSATPTGGAAEFDKMHRAKGWDELGYHFVIGNGTDTRDGQIEVGPRWPKQKWGAHDKTPGNQYNEHGIGICLVGNFDVTHPTAAQTRSLERLVSYLMRTYHIAPDHVLGHGETKATECPGRYMNVAAIRRACSHLLAGAHAQAQSESPHPGEELLADTRGH